MTSKKSIETFFKQKNIAIAGVSEKKQKFGNTIYKELSKKGFNLYPVHPRMESYDDKKCYHSLAELPEDVTALVINTKKDSTVKLLEEAKSKGIKNIWMQQGCADKTTIKGIDTNKSNIITGKCILMFADPVKGIHGFHRWLVKTFGSLPN